MGNIARNLVTATLAKSGITINGPSAWDIRVHDDRFYSRILREGSLGLGEAYMDGWWDAESVDSFIARLLASPAKTLGNLSPTTLSLWLQIRLRNLAPEKKAFLIGEHHYDLGDDLYARMLDATMTYTCGYWAGIQPGAPDALRQAQIAKLNLVCRKLKLQPGMTVLEIGCGWGGFAHYAAANYGVEVVGLTVSQNQAQRARQLCQGLPVEIRLQDYRSVTGRFDRIVSLGMFEHVERKNHGLYMEVAKRCLHPRGLFLLHSIGSVTWMHTPDPWIRKYIFPLGDIPSRKQITNAARYLLEIRDWHEFGRFYDFTLMAWHERFVHAWPELERRYAHLERHRFFRMWTYYLQACAGAFRARKLQLWQIVLSHPGNHLDYETVR